MELAQKIVEFFFPTGLLGLIILGLIGVLIYAITHPEIIDKWSELYSKYIEFWNKNRKKKIVSSELNYRVTKIARLFNKESLGLMPFGLRIKWINNGESSATVHDDEVILVLKEDDNIDKNIVDTCMLFAPKALLPKSRGCCSQDILKNLDLFTVKKMLTLGNFSTSYNYYLSNILAPMFQVDPSLNDELNFLELTDEKGFYSRILLEEYKLLGEMVFGSFEESKFINETIEYYNFVKQIIQRTPGDDKTKLLFVGNRIKIGIVFVAKYWTINSKVGLDTYVDRVAKDFAAGAKRIYVMGYSITEEENELDKDGYVINVYRYQSFKYMDYIEQKLNENLNYDIKMTEKFNVKVDGRIRSTKLLCVEERASSIDEIHLTTAST